MAKYKVANSGRKEHIPGEIAEKWETNKTCTLDEQSADGRFLFTAIYNYLRYQQYPVGASKLEKNSLRRRSKYLMLQNEDLYYIGGGELKVSCL